MKVVFKPQGFYDLRREPAVVGELDKMAEGICARANAQGKGTFAVGSRQGIKRPQGRWRASVVTADAHAIAADRKHNILLRAMAGGS
ncbi:hypothetical protein WKY82_09245 [Gordonia malaquae]|uniref:hypothetical protein n=1 Tax=Gordonia malaquae TaxID=410332 RepID=UPI0030C78F53